MDRFGESAPAPAVFKYFGFDGGERRGHGATGFGFGNAQGENQMTIKVAINGYGRIGRNILRAHYEGGKKHDIADRRDQRPGEPKTNAHLTKYDTAHGRFQGSVAVDGDSMVVNGDRIKVLAQRDPAQLPWGPRRRRGARVHRLLHDQGERPART